MTMDLTTVGTRQAVEKLDMRATAYQGGASNDIDQQVATYIDQVEQVLEVRGVNRLDWLKEVRNQVRLRLHGSQPSALEDRSKHPPLSAQRRIDYFAAIEAELSRLVPEAEV